MSLRNKGFTIIELIVVIAIMLALYGLILTNIGDGRSVKGAAQEFANLLRNIKSKALLNETGSAVVIEQDSDYGSNVYEGHIPYIIECSVTKMPNPVNNGIYPSSIILGLNPLNAASSELKLGYRTRLYAGAELSSASKLATKMSDWYSFSCINPPLATISFDNEKGQTSINSYWHPLLGSGGLTQPLQPPPNGFYMGVARYPDKGMIRMIFPKIATIDLRYSGVGSDPNSNWGNLENKGQFAVIFEKLGGLDAVVTQLPLKSVDPGEIFYFFIVSRKEKKQDKQLASENAFWVAIHYETGQVVVSSHIPQENNDTNSLIAARENARKSLSIGK